MLRLRPADKASLALSCKKIYGEVNPELYSTIHVKWKNSEVSTGHLFLRTVMESPSLAESIAVLSFTRDLPHTRYKIPKLELISSEVADVVALITGLNLPE